MRLTVELVLVFAVLAFFTSTSGKSLQKPYDVAAYIAFADTDSVALTLPDRVSSDSNGILIPVPNLITAAADTDSVAVRLPALPSPAEVDQTEADLVVSQQMVAAADSDTVGFSLFPNLFPAALVDSIRLARSDSTRADTSLAARYLPPIHRDVSAAHLVPRKQRALGMDMGAFWRHEIRLDSTGNRYLVREYVGQQDVRYPLSLDAETYKSYRYRDDNRESLKEMVNTLSRRRQQRRRGLGINVVVPGGRQSAFTTIFGKPELDLRVNGQVNIDAGFAYQQSDQQTSLSGRGGRLDPDFGQNIRLGITGSIGDKLQIDVNWDTERQFDYQNQLKLEYTGYEDEIIKRITAGNVFLKTPSTLIQGGQSLFGIQTEMQVGGVRLTTVMSQQEGESEELNLEGGSQVNEFEIRPTDYEDDTHFYLGYYFRNHWEEAHADPPILRIQIDRITDIEVWKLQQSTIEQDNERQVIALVDLAESDQFLENPFLDPGENNALPNADFDNYSEDDLTLLRDGTQPLEDFLTLQKGIPSAAFQVGKFKKLVEGRDYDFDEFLGYITLQTRLTDNEAIAVAYRYVDAGTGQVYQVGDFANESGGATGQIDDDRLVLKLLRKGNQIPTDPSWTLMMKNIYRIPGGRGLNANDFELDVYYERPGQPASKTLPGVVSRNTLLQLLGLDRLNEDESKNPDNRFDFQPYLIRQDKGILIFPYLQPFGNRIAELTENDALIFSNLYTEKKAEARRDSQHDVYRIRGSSQSGVQSVYNLGFFGVVEGSVRVNAGGTELVEGTDYIVDYSTGTVTITNPAYLSAGRNINIDWERNAIAAIQKKTLIGFRADYDFLDRIQFGGTLMRLSEKPVIDKFRVGDEPISNVIWGVDGAVQFEPRWLTRAIDALPFIQTKEPSSINFKGEFAQLLPGHPNTQAFERTQRNLQDEGMDFKDDELGGISYIDEFESFENTIALTQPGVWRLSSAPDSIRGPMAEVGPNAFRGDSVRTTWRGTLGWYVLQPELVREFADATTAENAPAIRSININEVFPNKDVSAESAAGRIQRTFDLFYDPAKPGPYNYGTSNLDCFDENQTPNCRKNVWAGIMQRLPEGYTDFDLNNVEFVEFIFSPYPHGQIDADARLMIDLGSISEDVVPNEKLNTEDGLVLNNIDNARFDQPSQWSRLPTGIQDAVVDVDTDTRRTEDLGLDGLPSSTQHAEYELTEQSRHSEYLDAIAARFGTDSRMYQRALSDPSGDDYFHFRDLDYFTNPQFYSEADLGRPQMRWTRFFPGFELNSFEAHREIAGNGPPLVGNSKLPDTEDINLNATLDTDDRYYQYEIPINIDDLERLSQPDAINDFVVRKIRNESYNPTSDWYVVRIPVREFTRRVNGISDFNLIQTMRMWITGMVEPITLRFASLELVGSQWQKSTRVGDAPNINDVLSISAVNNEESQAYRIPNGTVVSQTRNPTTGNLQNSREQAMVLRVKDMNPGDERAIFKTFNQQLDLLKYSHLRMFVHAHGGDGTGDGTGAGFQEVGDLRLFLRLGLNEDNDYYEYEQVLVPSNPNSGDPDEIWQTNRPHGETTLDLNSLAIPLTEFNLLKVQRDDSVAAGKLTTNQIFSKEYTKDPRVPVFGDDGVRLNIRGNPSLSGVTNITIGLRTDSTSTRFISDAEVWLNELRVGGYDEENGWAAVASAQIKLADLATISANIRNQTDGFGDLSSGLGSRETNNSTNWTLNTSLNLHKFIPERYGWNVPFTYSVRSNLSTPRFSPERGDIRLKELIAQVEENENLSAAEKQQRKDEIQNEAETYSYTRSISVPVSKRGSSSAWLRNTIDALSVNYSSSESESNNPSTEFNNSWRWSSSVSYRLTTRDPHTIRPFWFLENIPVLNLLGRLRMSYVPQSISASASAQRNFTESKERSRIVGLENPLLADSLMFQERLLHPIRETHALSHDRNFDLQYNPFTFLNLGYDSAVNQSLRALGVDTTFSVVARDQDGDFVEFDNTRLIDLDPALYDSTQVFEVTRLDVVPASELMSRIFNRGDEIRTDRFNQSFSATFQPQWRQYRSVSWITLQPIAFSARFQWQNGPAGQENIGASISNNSSIRGGLRIAFQEFWRKFDFYSEMERTVRDAADQARIERARRNQEREQQRQAEEARRLAEEEARERGEEVAPDSTAQQPAPAQTDSTSQDGGGFSIPFPSISPKNILRKTFLALTSTRDLNITYNSSWGGSSSNVKGGYGLFDAFNGKGPSLSYRLGLSRTPDSTARFLENPNLQVADRLQRSNQLGAKTDFSLGQTFRIDVNWDVRWDARNDISYRQTGVTDTRSGSNQVSIWTFGGSYDAFFESQLNAYLRDAEQSTGGEVVDVNNDGTVLSNETLVRDFRDAFTNAPGTVGDLGFIPFPMPNWTINYTGFGTWPLIRFLAQSATLRHGYNATYDSDYRTNVSAGIDAETGEPLTNTRSLRTRSGQVPIRYVIPELEVGSIRINERFQPLLGVNVTWKGGIQTDFNWNKSRSYSLSTTNADVNSSSTQDFSIRTSVSKRGLKLPFFNKRFNNTIRLTLTLSISENIERRFRLQPDLEEFLLEPEVYTETFKNPKPISTKRLTAEPRISYTFSNRVSADFFVKYEQSDSSRLAKTTNIKGGFNVRVNINN